MSPRSEPFQLVAAASADELAAARALMRDYAAGLAREHGVDLERWGFAEEVDGLPGAYGRPAGELLLARDAAGWLGCGAMRPLAAGECELKRMYTRPMARGRGVGRGLAEGLIAAARRAGYRRVLLDTLPGMTVALALYRDLGFLPTPPYAERAVPHVHFLALALDPP